MSNLGKAKLVEVLLAVGLFLMLLSAAGCVDVEYNSSGRVRTQVPTFQTAKASISQPVIVPVESYYNDNGNDDNTILDDKPEPRFAKFTGGIR